MRQTYRYRSFFWPAVLILVGVIALLINAGRLPVDRLYELANLWPLILVVIGLELIMRRSMQGAAGDVAAALIVLIAIAGAAAYVTIAPNPSASHTMDASAQVGGLTQGSVEIDAGGATVKISSGGDIGSDLYRAHIEWSGTTPKVSLDSSTGRLKISQSNGNVFGFQSRKFVLDLELNAGLPWEINENTGATTDTIDAGDLHVTAIMVNTGASKEEITLGAPSGVVPVQVNGGALTVHVHRPAGTNASVDVSGGAVSLDADGHGYHAIGNVRYQTPDLGTDYYRIQVNGGACTVTLDSTG